MVMYTGLLKPEHKIAFAGEEQRCWPHFHLQVMRKDNLRLKCGLWGGGSELPDGLCLATGHLTSKQTFLKRDAYKHHMNVVMAWSLLFGDLAINFWSNFFHANDCPISHTHCLLCTEWKANYSALENCFIYLQATNCHDQSKKITTNIEKSLSHLFSANKMNV